MARSVELGSMSPATCTWAPVDCNIQAKDSSYEIMVCSAVSNTVHKRTQHLNSKFFHLYHLSNFLDLAATLPNEGTTLAGRHHNAKSHGGLAGGCAVCHWAAYVLEKYKRPRVKPFYVGTESRLQIQQYIVYVVRTSSSFSMIMENALKMAVVGPAKVIILSGQLPSEMLMRAPLYTGKENGIYMMQFYSIRPVV